MPADLAGTRNDRGRSRTRAVAATILVVCVLLHCTGARAQGPSRTDAVAGALVAGAARHVPKGYASATASRVALNADDRQAGMIAGVLVALAEGDPKGSLRYALFPSEQQAEAFARDVGRRLGNPVSRKFLQYLPDANCADVPNGGLCTLRIGDIVIVATASQVDRGATLILLAAKEALEAAIASTRSNSSSLPAPPKAVPSGVVDACAVLTKADAAAALGGPVGEPRRGGDTCYYGAMASGGDSVTLQIIDGGRSKFDFDRGRLQRTAGVQGVGDDAFLFASQAGFVQVYFMKGAVYASLTLQNSRDGNRIENAKSLARKIAAHL